MDDQFLDEYLFAIVVKTPWYADVTNYMAVGNLPKHLKKWERKHIVQHSARFSWIGGYLIYKRSDMCIRRCVREDEIYDILKAYHDEPCGGHFADHRTRHKALQMGYYWPTILKTLRNMSRLVIAAKGWVVLVNLTKCSCSPNW